MFRLVGQFLDDRCCWGSLIPKQEQYPVTAHYLQIAVLDNLT